MEKNIEKKVAIILPTHNRREFLVEAIASVRAQSFQGWELFIVDDGSYDESCEAVRPILSEDSRVHYKFTEQRGVSAARNLGASLSYAPLIAFLDSDDIWLPEKLSTQVAFMERNPWIKICQTEELWVRSGKRVNPALKHEKKSGWIFKECLPLCIISPSAVMIERIAFDSLGGFDEQLPACEDYDLWLRAALRYEIATLPDQLIIKRGGHSDQLSRQWGLDRYRIIALEKILDDALMTDELRALVIDEIIRRAQIFAAGAKKRDNLETSRYYSEIVGRYLKLRSNIQ